MANNKRIIGSIIIEGDKVEYTGRTTSEYTHLVLTSVFITEEYKQGEIERLEAILAELPTKADAAEARAKLDQALAISGGEWTEDARTLRHEAGNIAYRAGTGKDNVRKAVAKAHLMKLGWQLGDVARAGRIDLARKQRDKALKGIANLARRAAEGDEGINVPLCTLKRRVDIVECRYL